MSAWGALRTRSDIAPCPKRAQYGSGRTHSITSSAAVSSDGGIVRPSVFAVFRLMTNSNFVGCTTGRCRPGSGWNWAWRILREHEGIVSGCEVNRLIARLYGERLPSIDLAHVDLSRGEQRPEQHGCGVC